MEPPYNRGYLCSGRDRANKKLPLPDFECEDSLFWPFTYNGIYNSKTGYRFLKAEGAPDGNEDHVELDKALWRGIWSLQILNKMKNLTWRACQYLLRTKQNLVCRTIINSPLCDRCKLEPETTLHALWSCSKLDVMWEDGSNWACRRTTMHVHGFQGVIVLDDKKSAKHRAVLYHGMDNLDTS